MTLFRVAFLAFCLSLGLAAVTLSGAPAFAKSDEDSSSSSKKP